MKMAGEGKFNKEELVRIGEILKTYMTEHPERTERENDFAELFSGMAGNLCHDDCMYIDGNGYFEYRHG